MQNNKINTVILVLFGVLLLVALGFGIWYLSQTAYSDNQTGQPQPTNGVDKRNVPTQAEFPGKIVYSQDTDLDTEPLKNHCQSLGGVFNECGTPCAPDATICATVCAFTCEQIPEQHTEIDMSDWQTFTIDEFDVSLRHPASWQAHSDTSVEASPKFNVLPQAEFSSQNVPLDHFDNTNHISIYPKGVPTEGMFGQTTEVNFDTGFPLSPDSKIFVLEDGTPYAAMLKPQTPPLSWNENGFVWLRLAVDNLETSCLRDGEKISSDLCDPLTTDDEIIRNGSVNQSLWQTQTAMASTLTFEAGSTIDNLIRLDSPRPEATISSPLTITGEARGQWFFEATFPVTLTNWDGLIIAEGYATAQDEWMTEDYVPFTAELEFESPYQPGDPEFFKRGSLILQRANPSGLPQNDAAREITVYFE